MIRRRREGGNKDDRPPSSGSYSSSNDGNGSGSNGSSGYSAEEQTRRIHEALEDLQDMTVSEVMTPRVDVIGLPIPVHASDVARAVRESGHSCFPVYDDDIDNLVGVLYVNDLFRAGWDLTAPAPRMPLVEPGSSGVAGPVGETVGEATDGKKVGQVTGEVTGEATGEATGEVMIGRPSTVDISRRLRQPYLVPESRRVLDVLGEMRRVRRTFAVAVDEYGGVAGVLTVKDLLAALVGDLYDEFDPGGEPEVVRIDRTRWLIDGGASIDDVHDQIGLSLPEGKYVTLGGYIFDALGHIPEEGETLKFSGWEMRVVEMDRRRVGKVLVVQPAPVGGGEGSSPGA